jgi:hypothetical protein
VVASPAHATAVGLVRYGVEHVPSGRAESVRGHDNSRGIMSTLRNLLKDFF